MNLDIGATLSRAWKLTWENKALWLLGILAALGGGGGRFDFNIGGRVSGPGPSGPGPSDPRLEAFLRRVFGEVDPNMLIAAGIALACLAFLIGVVLFVLSMIGRGGLIGGIQIAATQGKVTFAEGWRVGLRKFWTVLAIGLAVWLLSLIIGAASTFALLTLCLAPLACVGFLLVAVLSVYTLLAQIAAVVDDLSVTDALSKAWQVVRANLSGVIALGLILVVINFLLGAGLAALTAALLGPAVLGIILSGDNANANMTFVGVMLLCLAALIPVFIVISGIVQTWLTAAWTLAYNQFTGRAGTAVAAVPPAPVAPSL